MTQNPIEILALDLFTNRATIMRRSDNYDTRTTRNLTPRQTFSVIKLVNTMQDKGHCEIIAARDGIVAISTHDSQPDPIADPPHRPPKDEPVYDSSPIVNPQSAIVNRHRYLAKFKNYNQTHFTTDCAWHENDLLRAMNYLHRVTSQVTTVEEARLIDSVDGQIMYQITKPKPTADRLKH